MGSSAIVAWFQVSPALLGIFALFCSCPLSAGAESAHVGPIGAVQAVVPDEPPGNAGAVNASVTVMKTSISSSKPSGAGIQSPLSPAQPSTPKGVVKGLSSASVSQSPVDSRNLLTPAQRRIYRLAASRFTSFCHDWERMLHEREVNNLDHLSWRKDEGLETATYTGYGKVESCECKESKEGLPIGKIRYRERNYSIAGKTIEQARHATPKLTHEINALEIFSWDKGKWFY